MSSTQTFTVEQQLDEASANQEAGRFDEAVQLYRSILQESPQNAEAQKGLHALRKLMKKIPGSGSRRSRRKTKTKEKARIGKAGSASRRATEQPEAGPRSKRSDFQRLKALYASGQYMDVEVEADRYIKKNPRSFNAYNLRGAVLERLGKTNEAVASYVQAITIKPAFSEAHNNLGGLLNKLGLQEQAAESYRLAIAANPDFDHAYYNQGNLRCRKSARFSTPTSLIFSASIFPCLTSRPST